MLKKEENQQPSAVTTTVDENFDMFSPFRFGATKNEVDQSNAFNFSMKYKVARNFVNLSRSGSRECAPPSPLHFHYKAADLMNTPQQQDNHEEALSSEDPLAKVLLHDDPIIAPPTPKEACRDTDSGNVGDNSSDSSDNEQDDKTKDTGSHSDNKDSAVEDEKEVSPESSAMVVAGVSGATPKSQEVQRFKDMHADTVTALNKHCEVWEKKAEEMARAATEDKEDGMFMDGIYFECQVVYCGFFVLLWKCMERKYFSMVCVWLFSAWTNQDNYWTSPTTGE